MSSQNPHSIPPALRSHWHSSNSQPHDISPCACAAGAVEGGTDPRSIRDGVHGEVLRTRSRRLDSVGASLADCRTPRFCRTAGGNVEVSAGPRSERLRRGVGGVSRGIDCSTVLAGREQGHCIFGLCYPGPNNDVIASQAASSLFRRARILSLTKTCPTTPSLLHEHSGPPSWSYSW